MPTLAPVRQEGEVLPPVDVGIGGDPIAGCERRGRVGERAGNERHGEGGRGGQHHAERHRHQAPADERAIGDATTIHSAIEGSR